MKIIWLGHSAFRIETGKASILIDPFLSFNQPFSDSGLDIKAVSQNVTHILLTHGHADHVGDTVAIAKESNAVVMANADLAGWLATKGIDRLEAGNTGGTIGMAGFSATFTNALHSSAQIDENGISHDLGSANGLFLRFDDEPSLLHMGDTEIFSDMALINEIHRPAIGIVPVGDRFTMGGSVAALACQRYFCFDIAIPCHYGTFPILDQTPERFVDGMKGAVTEVKAPRVGELLSVS